MSSDDDKARWTTIASALTTPEMRQQVQVWEAERLIMLRTVTRFWTRESRNFRAFVEETANSVEVSAIVLTSMEDMPQGFIGILMGVICPELMDLEALAGASVIPSLFEMIVAGTEKVPLDADASLISAELPPQAMRLLHLARSNALLCFLQNVLLLYREVDESVEHVELAE